MSCGNPHDVDCIEVIRQVYLYLDEENLDDTERGKVRTHLEECGPCLREYGIEREVMELVARCCGGDCAPAALRERIRMKLAEVEVEVTRVEYRAE